MILVDIGNSGLRAVRIKDGLPIEEQEIWRLSWPANLSVKGKSIPVQQQARNHKWCEQDDLKAFEWLVDFIKPEASEKWIVSSVKQSALDLLRHVSLAKRGDGEFRKLCYADLPLQLDVESPEKVGMDRLLSSWEAWQVINTDRNLSKSISQGGEKSSVITVQAGTAVTVDLVTADGVFRGGAIMPGLGLSLQLLAAGTEQLPWIANGAVSGLPDLPGKNTSQAIAAGVHACLAGGVTFLIDRYRKEHDGDSLPVMVTGGDAPLLKSFIQPPCVPLDHMVLRGLHRLIATKQLS